MFLECKNRFSLNNRGYLGPGGIHENSKYENCTGGVTRYIDVLILGEKRLWQNNPVRDVYHGPPFDPENILGKFYF